MKNKRRIAWLLCLVLLFSICPTAFSDAAGANPGDGDAGTVSAAGSDASGMNLTGTVSGESGTETDLSEELLQGTRVPTCSRENPLYADLSGESSGTQRPMLASSGRMLGSVLPEELAAYCTTPEAAGQSIVEAYQNRDNPLQIHIKCDDVTAGDTVTSDYVKSLVSEVLEAAFTHNIADPVGGDYMRWQYHRWTASTVKYTYKNEVYLNISLTVTYFTDGQQEASVTEACSRILSDLSLDGTSDVTDVEKIRRIYNWICRNVSYDSANASDAENLLCHSAYAAAVSNCAVCQGYALLFYRLCLTCGVDARLIAGTAGGDHGWNIVRLGDVYYNVDATWDAGSTEYTWFLLGSTDFSGHTRYSDYTTAEFQQNYPMASVKKDNLCAAAHCSTVTRAAEPVSCTEDGWTEECICCFCGSTITARTVIPHPGHQVVTDAAVAATAGTAGLTEGSHCSRCQEVLAAQEVIPALGYSISITAEELGMDTEKDPEQQDPADDPEEGSGEQASGEEPAQEEEQSTSPVQLYLDNRPITLSEDGSLKSDSADSAILTAYTLNGSDEDLHKVYPTGMRVWQLEYDAETESYTPHEWTELSDVLQYMGSSIRITGKKGIRMITGISQETKQQLIETGVDGWKLVEYGTVVAWSDELGEETLTLDSACAKSAKAYEKDVSDPVFQRKNGLCLYTNVLVGFSLEQCAPDLVMRPYLVLRRETESTGAAEEPADRDAEEQSETAETMVIYGGQIVRSIRYIAQQNADAFPAGSEAYNYIHSIIDSTSGDTEASGSSAA